MTQHILASGAACLARGDLSGAERAAASLLERSQDPDALHLMALVRLRQERRDDALALLQQSLTARPGQANVLLNQGKLLALMQRDAEAVKALDEALLWHPALAEAWYELGEVRIRLGDVAAAEQCFRQLLALAPGHLLGKLALGLVLKNSGRARQAEIIFSEGLAAASGAHLKSAFAHNLALAQYDHGRKHAALASFALVPEHDPGRATSDIARAELLQAMLRLDEAAQLLETVIAREPLNESAHAAYNDLLHRLGRDGEFLTSYDRAPKTAALEMGKARLLLKTGRRDEAHALFAGVAAREPDNLTAHLGAATALAEMNRPGEALAGLEKLAPRHPENIAMHHHLAAIALQARQPDKAAAVAGEILGFDPFDQYGLALMGTTWRMLGDERDESLNGYDELIQVFDLDPPPGYAGMDAFNAELDDWLERLHPVARGPLGQTLRGGSQSRGHIFGQGDLLVDKLEARIADAVRRYIAGIAPDPHHPFRKRCGQDFRFTGSWSSRLRDRGFHVNHIHPEGWISSCYYAGVPDAAKDENTRQGWIKFGEPSFDAGLGIRRAIQPRPGRLVLFPSYMWHGTIPFHDPSPRTTIAFDAVPKER